MISYRQADYDDFEKLESVGDSGMDFAVYAEDFDNGVMSATWSFSVDDHEDHHWVRQMDDFHTPFAEYMQREESKLMIGRQNISEEEYISFYKNALTECGILFKEMPTDSPSELFKAKVLMK